MAKLQKIGKIIKAYRVSKSLTQYELSHMLGKTQQLIGYWEKGEKQPGALDLLKTMIILGINPRVFSAIMDVSEWQSDSHIKERITAWGQYTKK